MTERQNTHGFMTSSNCPSCGNGSSEGLLIGLDVGSTTVKAVVVEPRTGALLWRDYQRHEARQQERALEFLKRVERAFPEVPFTAFRIGVTGSGAANICPHIGGCFVQEVNAVSLRVEKRYPAVRSVIELGGQDAKIVVFRPDPKAGRIRKSASMNDKCAGGTGVVIERISAKLGLTPEHVSAMPYEGVRLHPVAGKCGVFAETDITGLQKQGVPPEELMASLFESIVQQNLSVLTRGNTLAPVVLLLGGPNCFFRGLQECWRANLAKLWRERGTSIPPGTTQAELVRVPKDALYFAALGAVEFLRAEMRDNASVGRYLGTERFQGYIDEDCAARRKASALPGLVADDAELRTFLRTYSPKPWRPRQHPSGSTVEGFLGIDSGSTSTKAVLLDPQQNVVAKAYRLSNGNPIKVTQEVVAEIRRHIEGQGCSLQILGVATTGYAKDVLKDVLGADVALVETVAHARNGLHYHPRADVICDVGGQDIKVIILKNGAVKDFRLNTQCSAGNGYYLQSTAADFGHRVEHYADVAFTAALMPEFSYGCAVFMQADIVNVQRQGWQPNEIMAGLAAVLPKNIWYYVCQMPNLAQLGRTFVLQGGVQRNLAAVKAQVDFIHARFEGTGTVPKVVVHEHCAEAGAIGAALEAHRRYQEHGYQTRFAGLDALDAFRYTARRDETTRCRCCANKCLRTFIDVAAGPGNGHRRIIIANCEKGAAENPEHVRRIRKDLDAVKAVNPNLAAIAAEEVFKPVAVSDVRDPVPRARRCALFRAGRATQRRRALMRNREHVRIGLPRVLNMYSCAPFFLGFFTSLGVRPANLVWSDYTSEKLYKEGARRGSIDPCYPSKLAIPHLHNLLFHKHSARAPLTHIFFPMINTLPTWLRNVQASRACPSATATPESAHAAFVTESDLFAERGIAFKKTFLSLDNPVLAARQVYLDWTDELGVSEREAYRAVREGFGALERHQAALRGQGREILRVVEREQRLAIVVLARPYHNDPGINHGLGEEFQKLGYPILTIESLPIDDEILWPLFAPEVAAGEAPAPLSIDDVWKNAFSENSSRKLWAAKFVARHPNLIPIELSSFKCGHDAPIYATVEQIVECAQKPFFHFRDIDENRPASSIKIRVQTIAHFLERYQRRLKARGRPEGAHPGLLGEPTVAPRKGKTGEFAVA